jgi:hypothetical protein
LLRQKKEAKEKAALQSGLRLPARERMQVGSETNSLRSNMFRFFIHLHPFSCGASPRVELQRQSQNQTTKPKPTECGDSIKVFLFLEFPLETLPPK